MINFEQFYNDEAKELCLHQKPKKEITLNSCEAVILNLQEFSGFIEGELEMFEELIMQKKNKKSKK